jgi:hypothetical protein
MATYIGATPLTRAVQKRKDFKATASQTTFSFSYQPGYLDVYVNGVKQREGAVPEDYTASDGVNVVFHTGLALNAEVDLISLSNFEPNTITSIDEVDATAALQTTFNIPSYNPGYITVYLSGVRLDQSDYAATTGNTVVLVSGAGIAIGDTLAVHSFEAFNVADVYNKTASDAKYVTLGTPLGGPSLGTDAIIRTNAVALDANIIIPTATNGMSAGPINTGSYSVTLTDSSSTWTII